MKLIKIVKLQRVRYGDLEDGDEYKSIHAMSSESANKRTGSEWDAVWASEWVTPLDTDKYPPEEITYTIEGIPEHPVRIGSKGATFKGRFPDGATWFDESEIETRYI